MKGMIKFIIIITIFFLMLLWLYASGNLPRFSPPDERVIAKANVSFPILSGYSYQTSHWLLNTMRDAGINITPTYSEIARDKAIAVKVARLNKIKKIRREVVVICDSILEDKSHGERDSRE